MFEGVKDFSSLVKQAQEMQSRMSKLQAELQAIEITSEAGGGVVSVTLNGKSTLKAVRIDPSFFSAEDVNILEDLIIAAHSDAKSKMEALIAEKTQHITGGLPLPSDKGFI